MVIIVRVFFLLCDGLQLITVH